MKSLQESLLDDEDILLNDTDGEIITRKKEIAEFINEHYECHGSISITDDFIVNAKGYIYVYGSKSSSLTNGLFEWGTIEGDFDCSFQGKLTSLKGGPKITESFHCNNCPKLQSLEYAPKEVRGVFDCRYCDNITSLKYSPVEIKNDFICLGCDNLISLEGVPKIIKGNFICSECNNLKTLKGGPEKVSGSFLCEYCKNLISLEGAPKRVGDDFSCTNCKNLTSLKGLSPSIRGTLSCYRCGKEFTEEEVKQYSKVKKDIFAV